MTKEEFFNVKLPGVTTILGDIFGKDEFKDIPEIIIQQAAERGSKVHEYIEYFIKNGKWPEIELAYQIYIDYFIEWYNEYKPHFITSEQMLVNEQDGYKGIVDTIFWYKDKETKKHIFCMCDWKTSSNLNRFKTMCQLNLYERMYRLNNGLKIDEIRTLSLTKTGWRFSKFKLDEKISEEILDLYNLKKVYNNE